MTHTSQMIESVFAVLKPDLKVETEAVSHDLYARLDKNYDDFKGHTLLSCHEFSEPWSSWERHPAGDEIVLLLSGRTDFRLETPAGEETLHLEEPGAYAVIPAGLWHTAIPQGVAKVLFITPGEGTEHRSL